MCHPLDFLINPSAYFILYCVALLVYAGAVQHIPLLDAQISPSPELLLTFDEVTEYNYTCVFKILSLIKHCLTSDYTCCDFPTHKTFHTISL
jgi:hypothetical protein